MVASDTDPGTEPARREGCENVDPLLPFTVEINDRVAGARVLARAATATLARAIFGAACTDYPHGHVILKRGSDTVLDSATN